MGFPISTDIFGQLKWLVKQVKLLQFKIASAAYLRLTGGILTGNLTLSAGTNGTAPINLASGVLLTAPVAGAIEYDGKVSYVTGETSQRGVSIAEQFITLTSAYTTPTGTANVLKQLFDSTTNGALTVAGNTSYFFEILVSLSNLSSSTSTFSFGFAGTASYSSVLYIATSTKNVLTPLATLITIGNTAAATALQAVGTVNTTGYMHIKGKLVVATGGTIIPSISLSIATQAIVAAGSYFRLTPIGSNTVTSIGNWS